MDCQEMSLMLNTMHKFYLEAENNRKPYMTHRVRQLYKDFKEQAEEVIELVPLDSIESYQQLLGPLPKLKKMIDRKHKAIHKSDFETAAALDHQQKLYIQIHLAYNGFEKEDYYFCHNGKIFHKTS